MSPSPPVDRYNLAELRAMLAAAELYENQVDERDRRPPEEAEFIFFRCKAGQVPADEGDPPSLAGIYMADADVPEEGVLPVHTHKS